MTNRAADKDFNNVAGVTNLTKKARTWMQDQDVTIHELNDLLANWSSQKDYLVNDTPAYVWKNDYISAVVILEQTGQGTTKTTVISVKRHKEREAR